MAIYAIGYVTSGWMLGRHLMGEGRSNFVVFLAGWGILRVVALIPILNSGEPRPRRPCGGTPRGPQRAGAPTRGVARVTRNGIRVPMNAAG